jgi:TRAP-type C4-dicarboxylate transport system substrate-binding protein
MKMKKTFVLTLICTFVLCFGLLAVDKAASETIQLKFAHFMSPKHIQHQKSFAPFCENVEILTGGRVKIKIYPGGALGKPKQLPDAAKTGITDIAFIIPTYTTGRFPRISALDLPFLCDSAVHATKVVYDLLDQYIAEDFKDYKVLWFYSSGPGQLHSVTKPMATMEDLKGMKMRAPSAYMSKAFKILGANPVGMPISKLTMSLQKKVIDGMLTPYSAVKDFRLFDLVKHITDVNMYVTPMAVVMNKEKYNSLPDFAKKAIDKASGREWGLYAGMVYDEHDINTVKEMNERGKIKIFKLPDSERQKLKSKLKVMEADWVAEISKKGLPAKEILGAVHDSAENNR